MSQIRPAIAAALAATATALLASQLPELPAAASAHSVASWWAELGTGAASMTIAHLISIALTAWLSLAATCEVLLRVHPSSAVALVHRMARARILHRVLGGTVLIATATPSAAFATDDRSPTPPDDLVLVDQGPSAADADLVLVDVGAADDHPSPTHPPFAADASLQAPFAESDITDTTDTWTIERGDHLWRIAEETLRDRGSVPSETEVAAYWTRLIDANRDVIGDDPDLVLPGQVVRLPA